MKYTTEIFKEKAIEVHKNDKVPPIYNKVEYIDTHTKVCITCPIHGDYWQTPNAHLNGQGCPNCARNVAKTTESFIAESKEVHKNDKMQVLYDEVEYQGYHKKVKLICPIHGEFWQVARDHLLGRSCPICAKEKYRDTTENFIEKCKKIHGDNVIYDETEYINTRTKVKLICPTHGVFYQYPTMHLNGKSCPKCNRSKLERRISVILKENNIEYIEEHKFDWLKSDNGFLRYDFYLPQYNIAIECQGNQHLNEVKAFGGSEAFSKTVKLDNLKYILSKEHNIPILYIFNNLVKLSNIFNNIYNEDNCYHISDTTKILNAINSEKNEILA